jgi:4-aminobutyrate aminotransferase/diaminobutyrate-pyruvate transaminase/4-aminobutyrate aminotransferase/(S)-3-amino-2-methylpropionate transaminase
MSMLYPSTPQETRRVETRLRRIVTPLPAPESLPLLEKLCAHELRAMQGQPPIVWERAEGYSVHDPYGNRWIDWSSGVLITNAGHGRREIADAIARQAQQHLLTSYCFPNEQRAALVERLTGLMPEPLKKIFLLTTGSETVEFAIKAARIHGRQAGGPKKNVIVSYDKAFHGRTLGAQQAGGIPALKEWIGNLDPGFVQVPFPDGFWCEDTSFDLFEKTLAAHGVAPGEVCGVLMETYQGGSAALAPLEYIRALRAFCDRHEALLIFDEVQAGFGRCGRLWGFEHYGVVPDLVTWGKGMSSSLPIAAVVGRAGVMDLLEPGSASSTHSGNPICCAAARANVELILKEDLPGNAARVGALMHELLRGIKARFPDRIGLIGGAGLVAGMACTVQGQREPDAALARDVVWRAITKGVLLFSPVGYGGSTVKICPPLVIDEEATRESCAVLEESFAEILA